jgi:enoyl-CoA hydratase/carnithine racemase
MVGEIGSYSVEVSFGWTDEEHYVVRVFFEPPSRAYEAIMHAWRTQQMQAKQWKFAKGFLKPFHLFCAPVYADATFSCVNSPPEAGEMLTAAENIIKELRASLRTPLAYEAACTLANDVMQESKRRTSTRKGSACFV